MHSVGFEPTHLTIPGLKSGALDHSANCAVFGAPSSSPQYIHKTSLYYFTKKRYSQASQQYWIDNVAQLPSSKTNRDE